MAYGYQRWRQDLLRADRWRLEEAAQEAYGGWLGAFRWDYKMDGMHRREGRAFVGTAVMRGAVRAFVREVEQRLGYSPAYVVAYEDHDDGSAHQHSLWGNVQPLSASWFWSTWFRRFGRARVEVPRSLHDVAKYAVKYVVKGADVEIALGALQQGVTQTTILSSAQSRTQDAPR